MNRLLLPLVALVVLVVNSAGNVSFAQDQGHSDSVEGVMHTNEAGHGDQAEHDHGDHAEHDHGDQAEHDHGDHAEHDHGDHAEHDHGDQAEHDHGEHEEFKAGDFIIHHIADAHDIHLFGDIHIPLPVILYIEGHGLKVFMSSAFERHGHGDRHY